MRPGPTYRERKVLAAALRFLEAHEHVAYVRDSYGKGTPECRAAVERRKAARRSVLYHSERLRAERQTA